jgi:hypothetical protein
MVEQAHNVQNAKTAALTYGKGKAKSAAEVAFIKKIIGPGFAGLSAQTTCMLGAWLGGAPDKDDIHIWNALDYFDSRESARETCEREFGADADLPDVTHALAKLRSISPSLADLVEVKGAAKQANDAAYLWQTTKENAVKDTVKVVTDTAKDVGEVIGEVVGGVAGAVVGAQTGLLSGIFGALPWWLIVGGLVVLVGLGVALWFFLPRLTAASAGLGAAAGKAAPLLL